RDDHHVLDLVDAACGQCGGRGRGGDRARQARREQEGEAAHQWLTSTGIRFGGSLLGGIRGSRNGLRGFCLKSKSLSRFPRILAFSRTSGRESGRPSVFGSSR